MSWTSTTWTSAAAPSTFALNCLLHVPRAALPGALGAIRGLLSRGGLFYWGQYAGDDSEGVHEKDDYEPKRFFARLTDTTIQREATAAGFELLDFHPIEGEREAWEFQALTLRA